MSWVVLKFKTLESVIIGKDNSETENYINGNALRGIFVQECFKNKENKNIAFSKDIIFYDGYLKKGVNCFLPTPKSFEVDKHEYKKFKLNLDEVNLKIYNKINNVKEFKNPVKLSSNYVFFQNKDMSEEEIKIKEKIHIQANSFGDNKIFRYTAIDKEQEFYSLIKIKNDDDVNTLRNIFNSETKKRFKLGKSKSSGYGMIEIEGFVEKKNFNEIKNELLRLEVKDNLDKKLILYFLTKAVFRDEKGDITNEPTQELKKYFENIELESAYVNTEIFGGYNNYWNIELPKDTGISAGSIYVYKIKSNEDMSEQIKKIEENGLGYFRERGYGLVIANPNLISECLVKNLKRDKDVENQSDNLVELNEDYELGNTIRDMDIMLIKEAKKLQIQKNINYEVLNKASGMMKISKDVSNSKLYQLIEGLEQMKTGEKGILKGEVFNNNREISIFGKNVLVYFDGFDLSYSNDLKKVVDNGLITKIETNKESKEVLLEILKQIVYFNIRKVEGSDTQ